MTFGFDPLLVILGGEAWEFFFFFFLAVQGYPRSCPRTFHAYGAHLGHCQQHSSLIIPVHLASNNFRALQMLGRAFPKSVPEKKNGRKGEKQCHEPGLNG